MKVLPPVEIDLLADNQLREEAIRTIEVFPQQHYLSIKRKQIAGLRQLAANEPQKMAQFALTHQTRAEKRLEKHPSPNAVSNLEAEIEFWKIVTQICKDQTLAGHWNLQATIEQRIGPRPKLARIAGNLTPEQQRQRADERKQVEVAQREWDAARRELFEQLCDVFFQHFCIHYLYRYQPKE
jgi:hypothetical protein